MIAEGNHKARARTGALGYTKNGKEQVAIELTILEGPHEGQSITWYGYFTEKTMERTLESLDLLGWDGDNISDLNGIDQNEVSIAIEHEEYDREDDFGIVETRTRAKVRWINGSGGLALSKPMDEGEAQAFAQRIKGNVVAYRKRKGTPPPRRQKQRAASSGGGFDAPPPDDSDIPF